MIAVTDWFSIDENTAPLPDVKASPPWLWAFRPWLDLQPWEMTPALDRQAAVQMLFPQSGRPAASSPLCTCHPCHPRHAETAALAQAPQMLPPALPWGAGSAPAGQAGPITVSHTCLPVCPQAGTREASTFGSLQNSLPMGSTTLAQGWLVGFSVWI